MLFYSAGTHSLANGGLAVNGITKTAALEARSHDIRVNAVSPGFLLTPMIANTLADPTGHVDPAGGLWGKLEERQGRKAHPAEVGDVVVMLSTPRMSLVNAVNLYVDGGFMVNEGFQ